MGIDVGGTSVKTAWLDSAGREIARGQSKPYVRPTLETLQHAIHDAIPQDAPAGMDVGVCVPGATDEAGERVTRSVNIPALDGVAIVDLVPPRLHPNRIRCFTDVFAAGFDVFTSERLTGRLLAISLGTGVGAAVLDDGALLKVTGRSSGHFGQWDVTVHESGREAPIGADGGRGSVEAYLGRAGLVARYGVPAEELSSRVRAGDAPMLALAHAIRIAHAVYRPAHIRLLGGLGVRLGEQLPALRAVIADGLTGLALPDWSLAAGRDDHHAARGAARGASSSL